MSSLVSRASRDVQNLSPRGRERIQATVPAKITRLAVKATLVRLVAQAVAVPAREAMDGYIIDQLVENPGLSSRDFFRKIGAGLIKTGRNAAIRALPDGIKITRREMDEILRDLLRAQGRAARISSASIVARVSALLEGRIEESA